jgi:hypothetical protein
MQKVGINENGTCKYFQHFVYSVSFNPLSYSDNYMYYQI